MKSILIISAIAIVYALIRAKHDSYLYNGDWKLYAYIEGVFVAFLAVGGVIIYFSMAWWYAAVLGPLFAFVFWTVFDCLCGWFRVGHILYLGETGFDKRMRETFLYDKPIGKWKNTKSIRLLFFKVFWLLLSIGIYFSLYNSF